MSISVMSHIWQNAPVSGGELLIMLALGDFANDEGWSFPSVQTLAKKARLGERHVQRSINKLVEAGLIQVKKNGGPHGVNLYRVITTTSSVGGDNIAPPNSGKNGGDICDRGGDSGVVQGVTPESPRTIIEPSIEPSMERESAGAAFDEDLEDTTSGEVLADRDNPSKGDFEKRVQNYCSGTGYSAGVWPRWDNVTFKYIKDEFAKLSIEDRRKAEAWRDPYLIDKKSRGEKVAISPGNFFRDKMWLALDEAILGKAEKAKADMVPADKRAKPDGWAAAWGPAFMACYIADCLKGRRDIVKQPDGVETDIALPPMGVPVMRVQIERAYPVVASLKNAADNHGGRILSAAWHDLKEHMEFVPRGPVLQAWHDLFNQREWVWPVNFDRGEGGYLPKGGPDAVEKFQQMMRASDDA